MQPEIFNRNTWTKWLKPPIFMAPIDTIFKKEQSSYQKYHLTKMALNKNSTLQKLHLKKTAFHENGISELTLLFF